MTETVTERGVDAGLMVGEAGRPAPLELAGLGRRVECRRVYVSGTMEVE